MHSPPQSPPPSAALTEDPGVEEPKVGMKFDTSDEVYEYYSTYAKQKGFAVAKRTSKKGLDGKLQNIVVECNKSGKVRFIGSNTLKPRPQTKVGCTARISASLAANNKWMLRTVILEHNHEQSPEKARYLKNYRVLDEQTKRKLELNDVAGIKLHKTYDTLQIEAGGFGRLSFFQKDCRNELDKIRHLRLGEGDAEAMHRYFIKMQADNGDFFYALDLNENGRLRKGQHHSSEEWGGGSHLEMQWYSESHQLPFGGSHLK